MAIGGYPDTPDEFVEIVAIDASLKGCSDTAAALSAMDKNPVSLDEALHHVKNVITNKRVILGPRRMDIRRGTFNDLSAEATGESAEPSVRVVKFNERDASPSKRMQLFEQRLKKTEDDQE